MSLVPKPGELVDPAAVTERCDRIDAWAAIAEDVNALHGALAGLAAIDVYLDRSSTEGRARVNATMRRIETRIGALLGEPRRGERNDLSSADDTLPLSGPDHRNERSEFRQMAAHPEIVERVINEDAGDGDRPASRARVLHEIRKESEPAPAPRPASRREPQPPDAFDLIDNAFQKLAAFNDACERIPDFDMTVREALAQAQGRVIVGGIWLRQVQRAIPIIQALGRLKEQPLRSVQ